MFDAVRPANNNHHDNEIDMGNDNVSPAARGIVGRSSVTQNGVNHDSNDTSPSDTETREKNDSNTARQIPNYR